MTSLPERFAQQAEQCRRHGSPLTGAVLAGAASELRRRGPVRDLLAPLADDPPGTVPSLRFAGALHRLVLERRAPALALHYPSVGGTAPPEAAWPAAREVVATTPDLAALVQRPVQTNEVGRSAVLLGGLRHVVAQTRLPVRLLEVGASAGLNLRVDRFAYEVGDEVLGDPASPVRLPQPWTGALPPAVDVEVVERRGCDAAAIDPTTAEGRLALSSYVWADDTARFARLRGALQVAAEVPAVVDDVPASAWLAEHLADPVPGVVTVVWHSVVWQYLSPQERTASRAALLAAAERATPAAPLALLSMEPERTGPATYRFAVHLTTWPGGARRRVADAQGHGPPVAWH